MLNSAGPATASVYTATTSATPSSPTRPSRLRGLSYLRSYTHNHLHRAETPPPPVPPLLRSTSNPGTSSNGREAPSPQPPSSASTERGNRQPAAPSTIQSAENGWIPTIQGRSGLNRESPHPTSTSTESASPEPSTTAADMTRSRTASSQGPTAMANTTVRRASVTETGNGPADSSSAMPESSTPPAGQSKDQLPTIRFIPHVETRANHRPSLQFAAVSRQLKSPNSVVRVGRYSERDNAAGDVVGFKSKVVSRRHCEFWCNEGQWYVKDVKSSSGTFLNHVRLSSPGAESRPYPVNDGDVVQLGIDFKGGEEAMFRCVKIRIECNRGWQKALNSFNTSAHKKLFKNALKSKGGAGRDSDAASVNSSECSICLNPVAPCQALFVAPCSHVWHFKCVRNYINGPAWPNFNCPNCRLVSDLDADVDVEPVMDAEFDDLIEEHAELEASSQGHGDSRVESRASSEENPSYSNSDGDEHQRYHTPPPPERDSRESDMEAELSRLLQESTLSPPARHVPAPTRQAEPGASRPPNHRSRASSGALGTRPIDIAPPKSGSRTPNELHGARSATPTTHTQFALSPGGPVHDGPMTPRNDAGPFIFDDRDRIDRSLVGHAVGDMDASARHGHNRADSETF
ncbi:E3 ubiquitin-protein ligase DMA2 [Pseudocercospora fuligena]|uniref:E3 ubiquitin-protein ligase DMA2 n=1 Tax=Pseudocercospora fuligena TaxID=685502 RepID=A0A8H6R6A4_9PEZI|nr:E3 ubiquitin-protein ligase DMA2 [Pseudocercospora fuligena]